jgi:hypothetical protein
MALAVFPFSLSHLPGFASGFSMMKTTHPTLAFSGTNVVITDNPCLWVISGYINRKLGDCSVVDKEC